MFRVGWGFSTASLGHITNVEISTTIRHAYGEKRLVTFGMLEGDAVVMVHTERRMGSHIISLRKAEKYEARYYFKVAKDYFK